MKKAKATRVPVLENAFEVNLSKLMRVKPTGEARLVLDDGVVRTVAVLTETRLAIFLGGRHWVVDIVPVQCLKNRLRPLLKCPRAHEGNFQSLYFRAGELACRHCHKLRYRTNVAATAADRIRIAREKLLLSLGAELGQPGAVRQPYTWRKRHLCLMKRVEHLTSTHYHSIRVCFDKKNK